MVECGKVQNTLENASMFDIRDHLDVLTENPKEKGKWFCPACGGHNLSINKQTGAYNCWSDTSNEHLAAIRENLSPARPQRFVQPKGSRAWRYLGNSGQVSNVVNRIDDGNGGKEIKRNVRTDENPLPLYWDDAIRQYSEEGGYVFLVEGESTCDSLRSIGFNAITLIGGSSGYRKERYFDLLSLIAEDLVLCPDMDAPGVKCMNEISKDFPLALWCYTHGPNYYFWAQDKLPASGGIDLADAIAYGASSQKILSWVCKKQAFALSGEAMESDIEITKKLGELRSIYEGSSDLTVRELKVAQYLKNSGLRDLGWTTPRAMKYCITEQLNQGHLEIFDSHQLMNLKTKRPRWIIPGFLPSGSTVLLGAYGGIGKTTLCYQLAKHVATGQTFCDYPVNKGKVLIISADESTHDTKEKLQTIDFNNVPKGGVSFIRYWRFTQMDLLIEKIKTIEPVLVIIDSLTSTTAGISADRTTSSAGDCIYELRDLAQQFECTFLILHHLSKMGEFRDSSTYVDNVSEAWKLTKDQHPGDYILDYTQKSRAGLQGKLVLRRSIEGYRWDVIGRIGASYTYESERRLFTWINENLNVDGVENWLTADSIAMRVPNVPPSEVHAILPVLRLNGLINCDTTVANGKTFRRYAAHNAKTFTRESTNVVAFPREGSLDSLEELMIFIRESHADGMDSSTVNKVISDYPFSSGERDQLFAELDYDVAAWLAVG